MVGDEIKVRIIDYENDNTANIITDTGIHGILRIKGNLKINKDGYIKAWIMQEIRSLNRVICGNSYFGKFSISDGIRKKYIDILNKLYGDVESLTSEDISMLKGAVNRCLKHDQWDWYTTYSFLGFPAYKIMRQFVQESIKARDEVREKKFKLVYSLRDTYSFMLRSLWYHLDDSVKVEFDALEEETDELPSAYWDKLLEDSKRNLKIAEKMKNNASQYILMHYFVTLEQEFSENYIKPFVNKKGFEITSQCNNRYLSTTHMILTGKTHFSLGAIGHLGKNIQNAKYLKESEALREYKDFVGNRINAFVKLCSEISRIQVDGLTLVEMRNGLAHGNSELTKKITNRANEEIHSYLFEEPNKILLKILDGSLKG